MGVAWSRDWMAYGIYVLDSHRTRHLELGGFMSYVGVVNYRRRDGKWSSGRRVFEELECQAITKVLQIIEYHHQAGRTVTGYIMKDGERVFWIDHVGELRRCSR